MHFVSASSSTDSLFFFSDTSTSDIYTLSLHDALPIYRRTKIIASRRRRCRFRLEDRDRNCPIRHWPNHHCEKRNRSEEHTSELQSHSDLVCRLLLEKKKKTEIPRLCTQRQRGCNKMRA